jgi:nucleoside-diphosphate-sugar epimerase
MRGINMAADERNSFLEQDLRRSVERIQTLKELKDVNILITGATGLIGVQLVRTLVCLNEMTGSQINILAMVRNQAKARGIYQNLLDREDVHLVVADITEKIEIPQKIDYIIHCASVTASKMMITQPVETILTSVEGARNMLELAKEKQVKKFLYLSSMEMYGAFYESGLDVTETMLGYINPLKVRSNYPESKRMCENMCIAYSEEYHVPVVIARLAQTFGAGILPGENRVFAQFARSAMEGKNIVLHTEGKSEGNYCYLSDAVCALFLILVRGTDCEAYNVANEEMHISIRDMAQMVCSSFGDNKIKVEFDIPETNQYGYAQDTKMKLSSQKLCGLGWKPEIGLEEAYRRMIGYMNSTNL